MGRSIYKLVETKLIKDEEDSDILFVLEDMINIYLRIIGFGSTGFDNIRDTTMSYIYKNGIEGLKQADDEFDLELRICDRYKFKNEESKKHDEEIRTEIKEILLSSDIRGKLSFMFNKTKSIKDKTKEDEEFQNYLDDTINGIYKIDDFLKKYKNNYYR